MQLLNNADIEFKEDRGGKGRYFTSRFIEAGPAHYRMGNGEKIVLVKKETLDKFINTMVGAPVVIDHQDITDENVKDNAVGYVSRVWFNDADGWFYCDGIIRDEKAETLITEDGYSVSCAYTVLDKNKEGGLWHDIEYDEEVLDGTFDHLAIVSNPRYKDATILLNSTDIKEQEEEVFSIFNSKKLRNSKEDEMDKRKKISEVEAILFAVKEGKEELTDELIKTIVGKMEKDAYETSENESEEEEKEEDKKENACGSRKNESEEKEDEKEEDIENEEDEEEDEKSEKESKKDDEEEKVKNSSSYSKLDKLSNSCESTPKVHFDTESERLARGKNY